MPLNATLLIAVDGEVVGDLRIPGMADHLLYASCSSRENNAEFVALAPADACDDGDEISPVMLWEREGPSLIRSSTQVDCVCIP